MSKRYLTTLLLTVLVAAFLAPAAAMAAPASSMTPAVSADTLGDFEQQASRIRAEMAPGKRYADLSRRDTKTVERTLDEIHALLERTETVSAMNEEQKTQLITLQERANAILTADAGNELVCEWVKKTGSNRRERVCMTAHERDLIRGQSRDGFIRVNPSHKNVGPGG